MPVDNFFFICHLGCFCFNRLDISKLSSAGYCSERFHICVTKLITKLIDIIRMMFLTRTGVSLLQISWCQGVILVIISICWNRDGIVVLKDAGSVVYTVISALSLRGKIKVSWNQEFIILLSGGGDITHHSS